jgi:hypothetical protein
MTIDWRQFERKLQTGKTPDEAAVELGLDPDIVRERYNHDREAASVYSLEAIGTQAIGVALGVLEDAAMNASEDEHRIAAAGHLLKFATAAMKAANDKQKIASKNKTTQNMLDLFDVMGDWKLKKPGV